MKEVRIGLIGTGYIGKAHAIAYAQAPTVFNLRGRLVREMVAEVTPELAAARAQAFGFNRSTGDWRALVGDPAIDVVDICLPNHLHKEMALEAIRHGKHVYSEKPLALNAHDAREMVDAAQAGRGENAGGVQLHEKPDGAAGEGDYRSRRDWRSDPLLRYPQRRLYGRPASRRFHWHCFKETAGLGALGDLAAHIVNMAQYLVGRLSRFAVTLKIVVPGTSGKGRFVGDDRRRK